MIDSFAEAFANEIVGRVMEFSDAIQKGEEIEMVYSEPTSWLAARYAEFAEKKGYTVTHDEENMTYICIRKKTEDDDPTRSSLRRKAEQTQCPRCKAAPGMPCVDVFTGEDLEKKAFHIPRYVIAKIELEKEG